MIDMATDKHDDDSHAPFASAREAYHNDHAPDHVRARAVARYAAAQRERLGFNLVGPVARWGYAAAAAVALLVVSNTWFAESPDNPVTLATVAQIGLPELPARPVLPNQFFEHRTAVPALVGLTTPRAPTERGADGLNQRWLNKAELNETPNEDC